MVFDGSLGGAGDEHQAAGAGLQSLLDGILDQGLVDDREHLLRTRLGRREEARTPTGHWKHGSPNDGFLARPHQSLPRVLAVIRQFTGRGGVRHAEKRHILARHGTVMSKSCATPLTFIVITASKSRDFFPGYWTLSAHLNTDGRMLSHDRHLGQHQNHPTLFRPQSSH